MERRRSSQKMAERKSEMVFVSSAWGKPIGQKICALLLRLADSSGTNRFLGFRERRKGFSKNESSRTSDQWVV